MHFPIKGSKIEARKIGGIKMKKILFTLCALSGLSLGLSGCNVVAGEAEPTRESVSAQAQAQALEEAQRKGLLQETVEEVQITPEQAKSDIEKIVTADSVLVVDEAEVISEQGNPCYVFSVQKGNEEIGQMAIDTVTGDKFYYLGEGVLEDYKAFPAYNPVAEVDERWCGTFEGPLYQAMKLEPVDEAQIVYSFDSGPNGTAHLEGGSAKSEDGELIFLLSEEGITVIGGNQTGNYVLITEEAEGLVEEQETDPNQNDPLVDASEIIEQITESIEDTPQE